MNSASTGAPNAENFVEVPKILTESQIEFFVENGYLIMPDLVSPDEINELKADTVFLRTSKARDEKLAAQSTPGAD